MKLRITRSARADVRELFIYIASDSPAAAQAVVDRILSALAQLKSNPYLGHQGHAPDTLELVIQRTSRVAVYRVRKGEVVVLRVRHGAQLRSMED